MESDGRCGITAAASASYWKEDGKPAKVDEAVVDALGLKK